MNGARKNKIEIFVKKARIRGQNSFAWILIKMIMIA